MRVASACAGLLSVLAASSVRSTNAWDDLVLSPPANKTGPAALLLFGQGANIVPSAYEPLALAIQAAAPFPLWFAAPQCPDNSAAVPFALQNGFKRVIATLEDDGMPENVTTFYGGHSLGGAMMPDYVEKHATDSAAGMILMGAFLARSYKTGSTPEGRPQVEFPVPTLTIGGELDGLCRLTRIAEALYSQVSFSGDRAEAMRNLPVTTITGMNHMQFASGEPPKFVADNDLQSEISTDDAHALVSTDAVSFLSASMGIDSESNWSDLKARVDESEAFVAPIVSALQMEGYEQFLPPCYCERPDEYGGLQYGTCESTPSCNGGVPWTTQYAMPIMGGGLDGLEIAGADSIHLVTEEDPSCHLPHIHGNETDNVNPGSGDTPPICTEPSGCTLNITTVTEPCYDNSGQVDIWRLHFGVDSLDTGFLPISARELKSKMKSRQAAYEAAGAGVVSLDDTDNNLCAEINQAAIDWAFQQLPEATAARFTQYGQTLSVGEDLSTCIAGPCWIWDPLRFEKDDESNQAVVSSVYMTTENKNMYPCGEQKHLPCDAGFHYCKLLSPARAMEWYYVDGLRNKYSTSTTA